MSTESRDYRESHTSTGYGDRYDEAYAPSTYYGKLWSTIERPLVADELRSLAAAGARSCLDFACGTGRILEVCEDVFADTHGVDVSAAMLETASRRVRTAQVHHQDITVEPLGRTFDVATAFRFFRNAHDELRHAALDALREHLAPGGHLVTNTHGNPRSPAMAVLKARARVTGSFAASLSAAELEKLLTDHGFVVEKQIPYSYLPRPGSAFPGPYARLMSGAERWGRRVPGVRSMSESILFIARRR